MDILDCMITLILSITLTYLRERERKGEIYLSSFIYSVLVTYVGNDFAITRVISIVT